MPELVPSPEQSDFVTAFAPDVLLSGNGVAVAESTVPDSFVIGDSALSGEAVVELVASDRSQLLDLGLQVVDSDRVPRSTWTPALLVTETAFCHGVVGPREDSFVFVGERAFEVEPAKTVDLLLMPSDGAWQQVSLNPPPSALVVQARSPHRLSLSLPDADGCVVLLRIGTEPALAVGLPIGIASGGKVLLPPLVQGDYQVDVLAAGARPADRRAARVTDSARAVRFTIRDDAVSDIRSAR